jgi:hypothetical protein
MENGKLSQEAEKWGKMVKKEPVSQLFDARHALKGRITQLDREIDQFVYLLYGLTVDEIKLMEGA